MLKPFPKTFKTKLPSLLLQIDPNQQLDEDLSEQRRDEASGLDVLPQRARYGISVREALLKP